MTNEEAIKIINNRNFRCIECIDQGEKCCEALEMAISALENNDNSAENNDNSAEWIFLRTKAAKCSKCGYVQITNGEDRTKQCLIHKAIYHYCPECGAKMKGVNE